MYLGVNMLDVLREAIGNIDPHYSSPSVICGLVTYSIWLWCWGGRFQVWRDRDRIQGPIKVPGRPLSDTRLQDKKIRSAKRRRSREFFREEIGYFPMAWAPISLILSTVLFLGIWEEPPLDLISGIASGNAWLVGFASIQIFGDITLSRM
jgi:hypothetical protein